MEKIGTVLDSRKSTPQPQPIQDLTLLPEPTKEVADSLRVNMDNTFKNFLPREGCQKAKAAVWSVVQGEYPLCLIYGGVGNGKTHLLHAASIELYQMGKFTRVYEFADILTFLRSCIDNPNRDYNDVLDGYCEAQRLILDDVGARGSATEFGDRILETIVCARYGRELMTIMTTNKNIDDLPERVLSRFKDKSLSYLVQNEASDYRPSKE